MLSNILSYTVHAVQYYVTHCNVINHSVIHIVISHSVIHTVMSSAILSHTVMISAILSHTVISAILHSDSGNFSVGICPFADTAR